ncbi:hypothetical protein DL98DRAFT_250069 [Cadophora sp. DSE1049]|nr:hypothetical protein DL98DRAFT_250069 [Cadophora sp. DSE1049]
MHGSMHSYTLRASLTYISCWYPLGDHDSESLAQMVSNFVCSHLNGASSSELGSRLRRLRLLDIYTGTGRFPGLFQLRTLFQECPNVEDLGIGFCIFAQERDELYDYHNVLAAARNLQTLSIWEDRESDMYPDFYPSRGYYQGPAYVRAVAIMKDLHRKIQGCKLKVTLRLGDSSYLQRRRSPPTATRTLLKNSQAGEHSILHWTKQEDMNNRAMVEMTSPWRTMKLRVIVFTGTQ